MKKIGYLGGGAWGFCLATLLAENGHHVQLWSGRDELTQALREKGKHPKLDYPVDQNIHLCDTLEEAISGVDMIVESVTAEGVRPVFEQLSKTGGVLCPIVLTSKGIEQKTGLLLHEVAIEVLGKEYKDQIGCLSGPTLANEVIKKQPTSAVGAAYNREIIPQIVEAFTTDYFRVYPNEDIRGVSFGGAMKNIIAIACGISDGLGYGENSKAAIMTRGLHEIRKLAFALNYNIETVNGLSGMGDLCVTCASPLSRNNRFGTLVAKGKGVEEAKEEIGMVVEGLYSCFSAYELGKKLSVPLPITEAVCAIALGKLSPKDAVKLLLNREVKQEHL